MFREVVFDMSLSQSSLWQIPPKRYGNSYDEVLKKRLGNEEKIAIRKC